MIFQFMANFLFNHFEQGDSIFAFDLLFEFPNMRFNQIIKVSLNYVKLSFNFIKLHEFVGDFRQFFN